MNISKKDQKLILVLLGIAVFLAAYFGVCRTFNDKKTETESQISSVRTQIQDLQVYSQKQAEYQKQINDFDSAINASLEQYPGDVRSEDLIMYATEFESKLGITIYSISVSSPEVVSTFTVPKKDGESLKFVPVAAVKTGLTVSCVLNYEQYKKLLDYIYSSSAITDVAEVVISYDSESGKLLGLITIDKYFITSADYTYTKTKIPTVTEGTSNPFGTLTATPNAAASASPAPSAANSTTRP